MNLKHENIHEYVIKCTNTTQITLDDDFNVMDSKPDIDLIVKEWGMAVVNGVRLIRIKPRLTEHLYLRLCIQEAVRTIKDLYR